MKWLIIIIIFIILALLLDKWKEKDKPKSNEIKIKTPTEEEKQAIVLCKNELNILLENHQNIIIYSFVEEYRDYGIDANDAYLHIIKKKWKPKHYVYYVLMSSLRSFAKNGTPSYLTKSSRDFYQFLNESLEKENIINHDEEEKNALAYINAIAKGLKV